MLAKGDLPRERDRLLNLLSAGKVQLALSYIHIVETCALSNRQIRDTILAFIDEVYPFTRWVHDPHVIQQQEVARQIHEYMKEPIVPRVEAIARNLEDAVRQAQTQSTIIVWTKELRPSRVAEQLLRQGSGRALLERGQAYVGRVALFHDRVLGVRDADWSRRRQIADLAPVRLASGRIVSKNERQEFGNAVAFQTMPGFEVFHRALETIFKEQFESTRKPDRGDIGDQYHLHALPYVSHFTCDGYVYSVLDRIKMRRVGSGIAYRNLSEALEAASFEASTRVNPA